VVRERSGEGERNDPNIVCTYEYKKKGKKRNIRSHVFFSEKCVYCDFLVFIISILYFNAHISIR
jgi:hypothetical protein